uniref:Outer membrane autotransporter barrel domain-containing protein n=1 Tax=Candidatus Kentrum eta TaxID=2126337 RepID=A0A450UI94_9GAMM|nr:MAG: outer membrane autotransporter barrel domain-containing protein [Candidatus Kentron sp. H]
MNSTFEETILAKEMRRARQARRSLGKAFEENALARRLLAGASVAALVGMMGVSGSAVADAETLGADTIWASDGTYTSGDADGTDAAAGDTVELNSYTLTVTNNGIADDGSGTNTFQVGAVTDSTDTNTTNNDGAVAVTTYAMGSNNLSVTFSGDVAAAGGVTVTSSANNSATATFSGASVTSVITLDRTNAGDVDVIFDSGATAQTVSGAITTSTAAASDTNTTVSITSDDVTFTNTVGDAGLDTLAIGASSNAANATFQAAVQAGSITITDSSTANFDAQTAAFSVTGAITGDGTGTINVVDEGGEAPAKVTFASAVDTTGDSGTTDTINIGDGSDAGNAQFEDAVNATAIHITSGDAANEASTADFDDAVTADTITLTSDATGGAATATFAGDVTGAITLTDDTNVSSIEFDGDGGNQTIDAAIIAGGSGHGDVTVSNATGTVTFNSALGGDPDNEGNALGDLTLGTGSQTVFSDSVYVTSVNMGGTTANFAGDVNATSGINFSADGTATFDGDTAQTVTGAMTADTNDYGNITVSNTGGTVTFMDTLGSDTAALGTLTLDSGSTTVFNATVDATTLDIDGATVTFENAVTVTTVSLADGTTIMVSGENFDTGETVITASTANVTGDITIDIAGANKLDAVGESLTILSASTLNDDNATYKAVDSSLFDYDIDTTTEEGNVIVTITKALDMASSESALYEVLTALADSDEMSSASSTIYNALLNSSTEEKTLRQAVLQADTLGAAASAAIGVASQVTGVAATRLASLRSGQQYAGTTGFAAGDAADLSKAFWVRSFGGWTDQDERSGVDGYDADTYGVAFGVDTQVTDRSRVGVALAYANTDVDGDGAADSQVDIDGLHFTLYGDYTVDDYYLQGMLSYARSENDISEDVAGVIRTADYDADQYTVSVSGGMPVPLKGDAFFTPMAGLDWTHVDSDSYTTSGADDFDLEVNPDDVDAVVASLGAKYHTTIRKNNGNLIPSIYAGLTYDFVGDEAQATSAYTGGGSAFTTTGSDPARFGGELDLNLTYDNGLFSASVGYGLDIKSDYTNHGAMIQTRWKF